MKINEVMWFDQEDYPIEFKKQPIIESNKNRNPGRIVVLGLLRESKWCYKGVTLVYCIFVIKTLLGTEKIAQWIDLRTLIEKYGDYKTDD